MEELPGEDVIHEVPLGNLATVKRTKRGDRIPSQNFFAYRINEWQSGTILKGWKPLSAYDGVKFVLGLLLYVGITQHCHEKRLDGCHGLIDDAQARMYL